MEDENFGWNIEMQLKAVTNGLNIREIELPYRKRQSGTSKDLWKYKKQYKSWYHYHTYSLAVLM